MQVQRFPRPDINLDAGKSNIYTKLGIVCRYNKQRGKNVPVLVIYLLHTCI